MKIVFIMDPLASVKAHKDTSYYIMLAAHQRSHRVYHADQSDLYLDHNTLMAVVTPVKVQSSLDEPFVIQTKQRLNLSKVDVVFVRTDPPFNRRYFYTTLLLDMLPKQVQIINQPQVLRDWNEKLAALFYPELTPQTKFINRLSDIERMMDEFGRLTLKPVDGHGGEGIVFVSPGDTDWRDKAKFITKNESKWIVAQEYLPAAKQGDKRILMINGEPIGGILRLHAQGVELNNLDAGGTAHPVQLDADDLQICACLKDDFIAKGIVFCGVDVIGGKLIEINVTSPTGLQELSQHSGIDYNHSLISILEK